MKKFFTKWIEKLLPTAPLMAADDAPLEAAAASALPVSGLDRAVDAAMPSRLIPELSVDIKRVRIMVIEDERVMSAFIMATLRRIGILDLFAYEDGTAALRVITEVKPDLILTDIHMQPMGGIEFVRQLRALSNYQISHIPVIFLSADSSRATVGEVIPLGVSGYLVKPPSLEALAQKIKVALPNWGCKPEPAETDRRIVTGGVKARKKDGKSAPKKS